MNEVIRPMPSPRGTNYTRMYILQGRANPEAAYDAVGIDGARGSETVRQILAWAEENLTRDEKHVLAEELVVSQKTKRILDLLAPCLTREELVAVAKILNQPSGDIQKFLESRIAPQHLAKVHEELRKPETPKIDNENILSEDARKFRWKHADHYRIHWSAQDRKSGEEMERQRAYERKLRMERMAAKEFQERYPDAPKIDPYDAKPQKPKIAQDETGFYARFPEAKKIGHV